MTEPREPLYRRARNAVIDRLGRGDWRPGGMIPSEMALAAELGVSPGTMRKAIRARAPSSPSRRRAAPGSASSASRTARAAR